MVLKSKKDQLVCSSFSGLSPIVTLDICHSPNLEILPHHQNLTPGALEGR